MRKCRNWQTSKTKDLVAAMSCGFKSHLPQVSVLPVSMLFMRAYRLFSISSTKHRKAAIFSQKMSGFEVFLGLREHEVRSNPCLMPICRATHIIYDVGVKSPQL